MRDLVTTTDTGRIDTYVTNSANFSAFVFAILGTSLSRRYDENEIEVVQENVSQLVLRRSDICKWVWHQLQGQCCDVKLKTQKRKRTASNSVRFIQKNVKTIEMILERS